MTGSTTDCAVKRNCENDGGDDNADTNTDNFKGYGPGPSLPPLSCGLSSPLSRRSAEARLFETVCLSLYHLRAIREESEMEM